MCSKTVRKNHGISLTMFVQVNKLQIGKIYVLRMFFRIVGFIFDIFCEFIDYSFFLLLYLITCFLPKAIDPILLIVYTPSKMAESCLFGFRIHTRICCRYATRFIFTAIHSIAAPIQSRDFSDAHQTVSGMHVSKVNK